MKTLIGGVAASFLATAAYATGPVEFSHLELDLSLNDLGNEIDFGADNVTWLTLGLNTGLTFGSFVTEIDFQRDRLSANGDSLSVDVLGLGFGYQVPGGTLSSFGDTVFFIEYSEISLSGQNLEVLGAGFSTYTETFGLGASIENGEISNFGIDAYSFWASYNIPTLPLALEASYTNIDYDGGESLDRLSAKISYLIPNSTVKPYLEVENLDSGFVNETLYGIGVTFNIGPSKPKATTKYGLKSAALFTF